MKTKQDLLSKATKTVYTILRQIATLIPREFVKDTEAAHDVKWRSFDPWSHLLTLVIVQLRERRRGKTFLRGIKDQIAFDPHVKRGHNPYQPVIGRPFVSGMKQMAQTISRSIIAAKKAKA